MRPPVTECRWLIHLHLGVGGAIEIRYYYYYLLILLEQWSPATIDSDDRKRRSQATIASDYRWQSSRAMFIIHWAMVAGNAVTVIVLNIYAPSRSSHYDNYVINHYQNIYKMEAEALAVIVSGYVIINEQRKEEKDVDGHLRLCRLYLLKCKLHTSTWITNRFPPEDYKKMYAWMKTTLTIYLTL